ncbi:hypothetical protein QR680_014931 [Steinernema hermaphroditum]|uniref:Uncharacterized protein n=1 Tax=Steinernema hermaphroditum TaxID=289476 RepID=A0AA39IAL3_9BILA|nr:hypothetical protein QR680_014931 [Steinernema hermaphroditum]
MVSYSYGSNSDCEDDNYDCNDDNYDCEDDNYNCNDDNDNYEDGNCDNNYQNCDYSQCGNQSQNWNNGAQGNGNQGMSEQCRIMIETERRDAFRQISELRTTYNKLLLYSAIFFFVAFFIMIIWLNSSCGPPEMTDEQLHTMEKCIEDVRRIYAKQVTVVTYDHIVEKNIGRACEHGDIAALYNILQHYQRIVCSNNKK